MAVRREVATACCGNDGIGNGAAVRFGMMAVSFAALALAAGATPTHAATHGASPWSDETIVASDGVFDDRFGSAVAVDGDIAVVGAPYADDGALPTQGVAYVFVRSNGIWSETQRLSAGDGVGMAHFGTTVAVRGDTILVGAIDARTPDTTDTGAVYVYERIGEAWNETGKLVADDAESGAAFGGALAFDGETALVGAKGASVDGGGVLRGKVYVFGIDGGVGTERQTLVADDGAANDLFGGAVALDGDTALIGAPTLPFNFQHGGFAYVFSRVDGAWIQTRKLVPAASSVADAFGYAVALVGDDALVGKPGGQGSTGAAIAFSNDAGAWMEGPTLHAEEGGAGDQFASAIAMVGSTAVIGAPDLLVDDHQGAAFVFDAAGGWHEAGMLTESVGTTLDFFGAAVAFDGMTASVGVPGAAVGNDARQGAAVLYAAPAAEGVFCSDFDDDSGVCR